jgi:hypothetical protein
MEEKKTKNANETAKKKMNGYRKDAPGAISGINTPGIELPAYNPPVPNRAWTEMKNKIEGMSEAERKEIFGKGKPLNS